MPINLWRTKHWPLRSLPSVNSKCLAVNKIRYQLVVGLRWERLPCVHAFVQALPLVHPQLRLLHDGAKLVQVRLDLLVVFHILACDQQLDLGKNSENRFALTLNLTCCAMTCFAAWLPVWKPAGPPASGWNAWRAGGALGTPAEGSRAWWGAAGLSEMFGHRDHPGRVACSPHCRAGTKHQPTSVSIQLENVIHFVNFFFFDNLFSTGSECHNTLAVARSGFTEGRWWVIFFFWVISITMGSTSTSFFSQLFVIVTYIVTMSFYFNRCLHLCINMCIRISCHTPIMSW